MTRGTAAHTMISMPRTRRAFSMIEVVVVLFLIGLMSGITVFAFRGGTSTASARITQANLDSSLDAAVNAALGSAGVAGVTPARLAAELPDLTYVGPTGVQTPAPRPLKPGEVSVFTDPELEIVAVAGITSDGYCFFQRLVTKSSSGEALRSFGVVQPGSTTPCTGTSANTLLSGNSTLGTSWSSPRVFS